MVVEVEVEVKVNRSSLVGKDVVVEAGVESDG